MKIFSSFPCGDLLLLYFQSENIFDCCLIPAAMRDQAASADRTPESLVQFKLSDSPFGCGIAYTMRNSPCLNGLEFLCQEKADGKIATRFRYGEGLFFTHTAEIHDGWVRVWTEVENRTVQTQHFDQLASFSLGMISPLSAANGSGKYDLERVTEHWHHEEIPMERAGLERPDSLRFGTGGTMPVAQYYPFAGIKDRSCGVLWGAILENSGAWMLEFSSSGKGLSLSGGMPDYAFCGQTLALPAGAVYRTPPAVIACVEGDILDLFNRLRQCLETTPASDVSPVYCGSFDRAAASFLKSCAVRYYVLDADLNSDAFEQIETAGLIPGVALDVETVSAGRKRSDILTRNEFPLQVGDRVFQDYRDTGRRTAAVQELCLALQKKHIGYVRFVCPAAFRGGCDGSKSPLENQQDYVDSVFAFYSELRREMPELAVEFQTAGIGRLSAKWLALADVMTTREYLPDAAEAMAALDRQMLAPGSKCGVCIALDSCGSLSARLNAALQGRPVLSGNPVSLSGEQQETLKRFLAFYQSAAPVLRNGTSRLGHIIGDSCMSPSGWQMFCRKNRGMQLIVIHIFSALAEPLSFDIPEGMQPAADFSCGMAWRFHDGKLEIGPCAVPGSAAFLWSV